MHTQIRRGGSAVATAASEVSWLLYYRVVAGKLQRGRVELILAVEHQEVFCWWRTGWSLNPLKRPAAAGARIMEREGGALDLRRAFVSSVWGCSTLCLQLFSASYHGNEADVRAALRGGASVNCTDGSPLPVGW